MCICDPWLCFLVSFMNEIFFNIFNSNRMDECQIIIIMSTKSLLYNENEKKSRKSNCLYGFFHHLVKWIMLDDGEGRFLISFLSFICRLCIDIWNKEVWWANFSSFCRDHWMCLCLMIHLFIIIIIIIFSIFFVLFGRTRDLRKKKEKSKDKTEKKSTKPTADVVAVKFIIMEQ